MGVRLTDASTSSVCFSSRVETLLVDISAIDHDGGDIENKTKTETTTTTQLSGHVDIPQKSGVGIELFSLVKASICCEKLTYI